MCVCACARACFYRLETVTVLMPMWVKIFVNKHLGDEKKTEAFRRKKSEWNEK